MEGKSLQRKRSCATMRDTVLVELVRVMPRSGLPVPRSLALTACVCHPLLTSDGLELPVTPSWALFFYNMIKYSKKKERKKADWILSSFLHFIKTQNILSYNI
jgi:hypothetical protein